MPKDVTPLGVFSRAWLEEEASSIEEFFDRGLDASCDLVLGVVATRLEPRTLEVAGGRLELPRMEEKFAVRIRGRGPGSRPSVVNYWTTSDGRPRPLLVTDGSGEVSFATLRDLLFASMAVPVAFPPVRVNTCTAGSTRTPNVCLAEEAEAGRYMDGGVFDRGPLRQAVELARAGLFSSPARGIRWRDSPHASDRATPGEVIFAYVDPDATEYPPTPKAPPSRRSRPSLPGELSGIVSSMVASARAKELEVAPRGGAGDCRSDPRAAASFPGRRRTALGLSRLL